MAANVIKSPAEAPAKPKPCVTPTTATAPENEIAAPRSFARESVSEPTAAAISIVETGVAAVIRAELDAVVRPSAVAHRSWYSPKPAKPRRSIGRMSARGRPTFPSRQRRIASSTRKAAPNRTNAKRTGGTSARTALTATTLAPHVSITSRIAISARWRVRAVGTEPRWVTGPDAASRASATAPAASGSEPSSRETAGCPVTAGATIARTSRPGRPLWIRDRSVLDVLLIELERLLVALLSQLQPDEETGQHEERDDDKCGEHHRRNVARIFTIFTVQPPYPARAAPGLTLPAEAWPSRL